MPGIGARRGLKCCCGIAIVVAGFGTGLEAQPATGPNQNVAPRPCPKTLPDFRPSSGLGQFDASISGNTLRIELKVAFDWLPGDPALALGFPAHELEWTDNTDKRNFEREFVQRVEEAWSDAFELESQDGRQRLNVVVDVQTTPLANAHFRVQVFRYPKDGMDHKASVCWPGTSHIGTGCERHDDDRPWGNVRLASSHLQEEHILALEVPHEDIWFTSASDKVPSLHGRAAAWLANDPGWHFRLTGYADFDEVLAPAEQNGLSLARKRTANVAAALEELACPPASAGAPRDQKCIHKFEQRVHVRNQGVDGDTPESGGNVVRLEPFRTGAIDTLTHEAGHMLGVGDEAVVGETVAGQPLPSVQYAAFVACYTGYVITLGDDEGIMSRGKTVRPWHYAPFVEAAEALTPGRRWRVDEGKAGAGVAQWPRVGQCRGPVRCEPGAPPPPPPVATTQAACTIFG